MDFDQLLIHLHFQRLYDHLKKRPHQQAALARLYFGESYHIAPSSLWKALNSRGLVRDVDDRQPMLDSLTEDGIAFCKWYSRRMQAEAQEKQWQADPFRPKELPGGLIQHSLFEDQE